MCCEKLGLKKSRGLREFMGEIMTPEQFLVQMKERGESVDRALRRFLPKGRSFERVLNEAMSYSVNAGGKRLRPLLCLEGAAVCGGKPESVMLAACALEVLHTYSLVHDDLPAMDDDDLRRGKPTNHCVYGEGLAILAGDGLLTLAFELLARNGAVAGVRPERVVEAVLLLSRAAGAQGMVGGQAVDLASEGRVVPEKERRARLHYIHSHKTGCLLRVSLEMGAVLVGASPLERKALVRYGNCIGLAFQIADDVLDVVGNKEKLGKKGSDAGNGKLTFPAVFGVKESQRLAKKSVGEARRALKPFGKRGEFLGALADYIVEREF